MKCITPPHHRHPHSSYSPVVRQSFISISFNNHHPEIRNIVYTHFIESTIASVSNALCPSNYTFDANWMAIAHTNSQLRAETIPLYEAAYEKLQRRRKLAKRYDSVRAVSEAVAELRLRLRDIQTRDEARAAAIRERIELLALDRQDAIDMRRCYVLGVGVMIGFLTCKMLEWIVQSVVNRL